MIQHSRVEEQAMGYWSVLTSVDYMDEHCDYVVPLTASAALDAVEKAISRTGRVVAERVSDDELRALTVKHTPAWAFAVPLGWLLIRKDCTANIKVSETETGTVLTVRGKLDTRAASQVRALRAA
jgi:hypothetical protein